MAMEITKTQEKIMRWRDALDKSIQIYHQDYSYWEDADSYSYIIDRVMIHISYSLSEPDTLIEPYALQEAKSEVAEECKGSLALSEAETIVLSKLQRANSILLIPIGQVVTTGIGLVTMGIGLVGAALGRIAGRLEKRISFRHRRIPIIMSYVGSQKDTTGNELSRLVLSNDFSSFVGMDRQTKAVNTLLDFHSKDRVGEIGIWGVRGVGKTTLARFVYQQISPQFQDHYHFMKDTKNHSQRGCSTCLLEEITSAALMPTSELESLEEVVKAKLGHRKVLLIVDDRFTH